MTIFDMRKYLAMHCTGPLKQPIEFCPFVMQHRFMCQMCREVGHWSVMRVPQKTLRFHFESFPNIHNCWLKACVGQTCVTVRQGPIWWQRVNYKRSTRGRGETCDICSTWWHFTVNLLQISATPKHLLLCPRWFSKDHKYSPARVFDEIDDEGNNASRPTFGDWLSSLMSGTKAVLFWQGSILWSVCLLILYKGWRATGWSNGSRETLILSPMHCQ